MFCSVLYVVLRYLFVGCYVNDFVLDLAVTTDDHSRVRLQEIPNVPGSDYINANYIDVSSTTSEQFPYALY